MKLYLTSKGTYCGTQAEFLETQVAECGGKKSDYDAKGAEVEVPTDKGGLILYLNAVHQIDRGYAQPDPDAIVKDINEDVKPELAPRAQPSYTDASVGLDDAFAAAPLAHRLSLACLALEDARDLCPVLTPVDPERYEKMREAVCAPNEILNDLTWVEVPVEDEDDVDPFA